MSKLRLATQATPSVPSTGQVLVYPKSDKQVYYQNEDGSEALTAMHRTTIDVGFTMTIPAGFGFVAAAPFTNNGSLVNNGNFLVL